VISFLHKEKTMRNRLTHNQDRHVILGNNRDTKTRCIDRIVQMVLHDPFAGNIADNSNTRRY
jgi:hypothetical protein